MTFSVALLILYFKVIDLSFLSYKTDNGTSTILAPIASGVLSGLAYGAAIRLNCCTGGTDILAALIHKKWPEQNLLWIIFAMNAGVAIASYFVYDFKMEPVVLCIIFSFLSSQVSDSILRGARQRIKFEIISQESDAISREIIAQLNHTVTVVPAKGMFSGKETEMLICVVQKHQVVEMEKIILTDGKLIILDQKVILRMNLMQIFTTIMNRCGGIITVKKRITILNLQ